MIQSAQRFSAGFIKFFFNQVNWPKDSNKTTLPTTVITSRPATPDGANGFFSADPAITLAGNKPGMIFYRWDITGAWNVYQGAVSAPEGTHTLYFYLVDLFGNKETAKSKVFKVDTTQPGPGKAIEVNLQTSDPSDMALHFLEPDADLFSTGDASLYNPSPDWGIIGITVDDPLFSYDDTSQSMTLAVPSENGSYSVIVFDYNIWSEESASVTISIGGIKEEFQRTIDLRDIPMVSSAVWKVADVDAESGTINTVDTLDIIRWY